MNIYLIRHGESIMNTGENAKIGEIDNKIWLTENGKRQATKSAEFLKDYLNKNQGLVVDRTGVWVSPYTRTRGTFKIFDSIVGFQEKGIRCKEDILLAEQEFGLFDLVPEDKWSEAFPNEYAYYKKLKDNQGKFYARCPMGESPKDVAIRSRMFFDTIWRDFDKHQIDNLFIFTHGTVLRSFVMAWQHYTPEWYEAEKNPGNCWIRRISNHKDMSYIYKGE